MPSPCTYKDFCTGCSLWDIEYTSQLENKKKHLQNLLCDFKIPEIEIRSIAPFGFRDHFDFVIENNQQGLYSHIQKKIVDLPSCLQLSPQLAELYQRVRQIQWPIKKGSARIRVSPHGLAGIWLDFANLDIKNLFEQSELLIHLLQTSDEFIIEVGQRRKTLAYKDRLRLTDPVLRNWTRTWNHVDAQKKEISLYGTIASFSQAGDKSNQVITSIIPDLISKKSRRILEYGAGNGNLTFSYLNKDRIVTVIETEPLSIQGLLRTADDIGLQKQICFLNPKQEFENLSYDSVIANPPRSGLKDFLQIIQSSETTRVSQIKDSLNEFIYMSCFPESFQKDLFQIMQFGYKIDRLIIVDQFPQTNHYEIICRLI